MNTIWPSSSKLPESEDAGARAMGEMVFEVVWDPIFSRRMDDKDHVIACFERHNQAVIDEVPEEQLLVYRPGDGWAPICDFLGVDVPDSPYPKVNSTEDFQKRLNS